MNNNRCRCGNLPHAQGSLCPTCRGDEIKASPDKHAAPQPIRDGLIWRWRQGGAA